MSPSSTVLPDLLHGKETGVWGDQAYRGQRAVIRQTRAASAKDFVNRRYPPTQWCRRGRAGEKPHQVQSAGQIVKHRYGVIKQGVGLCQGRYRGLKKNTHRLLVTCALANLFIVRTHLMRQGA